jgi:hypothetical protein
MALFSNLSAVIAAGASLSGEVDLGELTLVGIVMPSVWTAASLTFQASPDNGVTWLEHYSSAGTETTFTVGASQFVAVDPTLWKGVYSLKIRSGTASAAVNQVAKATLILVTRTLLA